MFPSPKFILALVATLAVIANVRAVEEKQAENKWLFPGFWIPLNIPTPAPAVVPSATCDAATCCKSFCTGGTTAPETCTGTTCSSGTLSPTKCYLASAGASCTATLCTTCSTACPAATVTTDAVCA